MAIRSPPDTGSVNATGRPAIGVARCNHSDKSGTQIERPELVRKYRSKVSSAGVP
jgi:hypothetical protein